MMESMEQDSPQGNKRYSNSIDMKLAQLEARLTQLESKIASAKKTSEILDEEKMVDTQPVIYSRNLSVVGDTEKSENGDKEMSNLYERYNEEKMIKDNIPLASSPIVTSTVTPVAVQRLELEANDTKKLKPLLVSPEIKTSEINDAAIFETVINLASFGKFTKRKKKAPVQESYNITRKYNYKEDQWSPLNPEGKKWYDREFLIGLQNEPRSLKKPLNLPNLDIIKDKAQIHRLPDVTRISPATISVQEYSDPLITRYSNTDILWCPHLGLRGHGQQGCKKKKKKRAISCGCSIRENIKLGESENAWKPPHKFDVEDTEETRTQGLCKKIQKILSDPSPQKFETLVNQIKQLDIKTEEELNSIVDLVFEKAIYEYHFAVFYANICKKLALLKVPSSGQEGTYVNFRKILLTKCQRQFDRDWKNEPKKEEEVKLVKECNTEAKGKQLQEEFEENEANNRKGQLGNVKFIAELFKLGMLIEPIIHQYIKMLLKRGDTNSLEGLTLLLTTAGKELKAKKKSREMDNYFAIIQRIVDKQQTSSRVRFMLQELIDLRKNKWISSHAEDDDSEAIQKILMKQTLHDSDEKKKD